MIKKTIVVYSGRFQPFHKGHYASYRKLVSKFGVGNVYIGTSDKTDSGKSPFNFKEKVLIMNKMFGIPTNKIVQVSNPYAPKEILSKFDGKTTAYIAAVGEKDASRLGGKYFRPYDGDTEYGYDVAGYTYNIPAEANAISGTDVRNWLSSDKAEQLFLKAYPKFDAEIYKLITNKLIKEGIIWGYPSYDDVKDLKRKLDKIRLKATTDDSYVYNPVKEDINKLVYEADTFIDKYFSENESEDAKYTHIGYGRYKQKGKEKDASSPTFTKDDSGKYIQSTDTTQPTADKKPTPNIFGKDNEYSDSSSDNNPPKQKPTATQKKDWTAGKDGWEILDDPRSNIKKIRKYTDEELKGETGEYFENDVTKKVAPNAFKDESEMIEKMKAAKPVFLSSEDMQNMSNTDVGDILYASEEGGKDAMLKLGKERATEYGKDWDRLEKGIAKGNVVPSPIALRDKSGKLHLLAGNTRLMSFTASGKKLPVKVIDYDGEFQYDESVSGVEPKGLSNEDINIDVDTGDTVLMGKFKNKKTIVKTIGKDEYGMPTINGKKVVTFRKSKTNETVNTKSNSKARIVGEFIKFAKQRLELNGFPKGLRMITDSEFPKQMKSFGGYNPDNDEIFVYAGNDRNIVDVVRTLAHELVHLKQRQDGRILGPEQGKTGSDIENEANAAAGILLRDFGKRNKYLYEIDKSQLSNIERYADSQLAPADIEFAIPHFFDRLNDPRNGKEITDAELTGFFKRLSKHKKDFLEFLKKYREVVVKDKRNNLNIPFIKSANKVIAKTIMRKSDFKTYDYTLVTETDKKDMERELKSLYLKALKMFPNSPAQLKVRAQIDKLIDQIAKSNGNTIKESILTEGGAYGHMNHPFDTEINLTFGQLKDIVNKALDGELELTREKTDGQALAISWVNGKLVAARNKGHLANKGANALDAKGVATKFSGRGELEKAYNFAMNDLSKAVSALSEKQRDKIFKSGACFMNLEVIYPTSVNVIPYGQPLLVFHGTMEYNDKGEAIGENQSAATILAGMIKQVNQNVQSNYTIQGPPVTQLPKSQNLSKLKAGYISKISKLQSKFKLSDSSGIAEYHQAWWTDFIKSKTPEQLDANTLNGLVKRWAFYDKGLRLDAKSIPNTKVLEWAQKIDKEDHAKIAKDNIRPFEDIFLGVGSDVLSFMSSVLTANPDSAIRNMKTRLDQTISDVQTGGDPKKIAKLKLELERLNAIGGKDKIVPNEGIVFMYNGNTMKLTGTFAPLNQILGLFY